MLRCTKFTRFIPPPPQVPSVPHPVSAGVSRRVPVAPWLVADMDGTLLPTPGKAGGHYIPIDKSPCYEPVREWLSMGGNLCVISTAGRRMWRQLYHVLRPVFDLPQHGQLVVCGFSGAAMFGASPATAGDLVEVEPYRHEAVAGGTCISAADATDLEHMLTAGFERFFAIAAEDPSIVELLSTKYREPYRNLALERRQLGAAEFRSRYMHKSVLSSPRTVLVCTENSMLHRQHVPGAEDVTAQMSMLGVPMARFKEVFGPEHHEFVADRGLSLRSQPNSAVVSKSGVTKATCIDWLHARSVDFGFDPANAIAMGDAPRSVDRPLTQYPTIPFISLSPSPSEDLSDCPHQVRVGGEEVGGGVILQRLVDEMRRAADRRIHDTMPSFAKLTQLCQEAEATLLQRTTTAVNSSKP